MSFGKAGNSDPQRGKMFFNERDQFSGIDKSILRGKKRLNSFRRVTPECHDIFNSARLVLRKDLKYFVLRRTNACEMGNNCEVGLLLQFYHKLVCKLACRSACTVRNAHVRRLQRRKVFDGGEKIL